MTQLSEEKTYRTRDGSRTGIRVHHRNQYPHWPWQEVGANQTWSDTGHVGTQPEHPFDLIEEQPADHPFSYDACPVGEDGRRRAVTRDGREVVLLSADGPGKFSVVGCVKRGEWWDAREWTPIGTSSEGLMGSDAPYCLDLLVPPPPKRVVYVNLYGPQHATRKEADAAASDFRIGVRAWPVEIDP